MRLTILTLAGVLCLASCINRSLDKDGGQEATVTEDVLEGACAAKAPGMKVAEASMPLQDGVLANASFSVKLLATEEAGTYKVIAQYGEAVGESKLKLPDGGEALCPLLRKLDGQTGFMAGFKLKGDDAFKDLYEITAQRGSMEMRYVKHYSFR